MLTVYSKKNCPACVSAQALLQSKGIEFEVVKVDEDFEAFDFLVSQGHRSFPQIYDGDKLFVEGGFSGLQQMFK